MTLSVDTRSLGVGLDSQQHDAVFSDARRLCVLAGAGSGKTTVLTRRVARRIVDESADAEHALVLTFTRKAAEELRQRLGVLGVTDKVTAGTFHAVAYAQLRRRWLDAGRAVPAITPQPFRLVERMLQNMRMERSVNARQLVAEISWAKSKRLRPETYQEGVRREGRRPSMPGGQVAKLYGAYEAEKKKRRVVDYDDLLLLLTDALDDDPAFASAQRWMFRHFFVDELQDLNSAQFGLLQAWMGKDPDCFVVGDPNQAIYTWNGSDASYIGDIERHLPDVEVLRLETNYRSTNQVLRAAAAVLPGTDKGDNTEGAPVRVRKYVDERAEAVGTARHVRQMHGNGHRWSDIAVLVRTNAQRVHIERALAENGIPYKSGSGTSWLQQDELQPALAMLRESPARDLSQVLDDLSVMAVDAPERAQPVLNELERAARNCANNDSTMSCADFITWLEVACRADGPATGNSAGAVSVATFHRAKGLEWPVVFLAGLEDGLVPFGGVDAAGAEEERRLFYVALTRAKEHLFCSWAQERGGAKGVTDRQVSPWLNAVETEGSTTEPLPPAQLVHERIEASRFTLGTKQEPEHSQQERKLLDWRKRRAKLTGARPQLILSDAAIAQIVSIEPEKPQDLQGVDGLGPVRIATDGGEILAALRDRD